MGQQRGNPRCADCGGRGVIRVGSGWRSCACVRGTATSRRMQRYANDPRADGLTYAEWDAAERAGTLPRRK